jgi:DNA-binding transcriptional regulator YiaG
MINQRFPQDEHGTTPSADDWERANHSLARHLTSAAKSPRFAETRDGIAEGQSTLSELRRAFQLSQVTLAETLAMSQSELSRLERRADLLLSTLTRFVAATGGHLRLVANYPDRAPIELRLASLTQFPVGDDLQDSVGSIQTTGARTATRSRKEPVSIPASRRLTSRNTATAAKRAAGSAQLGTKSVKSNGSSKAARTVVSPAASQTTRTTGGALTQRPATAKRATGKTAVR